MYTNEVKNISLNNVSGIVIGLAIKVHNQLGPGLLESAYKECLYYELLKNRIEVVKEKAMPLIYEEVRMDIGYRIDLLVNNSLVIEIKSIEELTPVHWAQTLTYMKLGGYKLGLLINFNVFRLKEGIKRLVNGLEEKSYF